MVAEHLEENEMKTLNGEKIDGIEVGDSFLAENGKTYICAAKIQEADVEYMLLMNRKKMAEKVFAKQGIVDGIFAIQIVKDRQTLERLTQKFNTDRWSVIKQLLFPKRKKKDKEKN